MKVVMGKRTSGRPFGIWRFVCVLLLPIACLAGCACGACVAGDKVAPGESLVEDLEVSFGQEPGEVAVWLIGYPVPDAVTATLYTDGRLVIDGEGATLRFMQPGAAAGLYMPAPAPWCDEYGLGTKVASVNVAESVSPVSVACWFYGCEQLSMWPRWGDSSSLPASVEEAAMLFYGCENLVGAIPEGVFSECNRLSDFYRVFSGCVSLGGPIAEDLFSFCPEAFRFEGAFEGCTGLTGSIPEDLFASNHNAELFGGVFAGCAGLEGTIPEGLFASNPKANDFSVSFYGCVGLNGPLPARLFEECQVAQDFTAAFMGCVGITEVDADFDLPESAIETKGMFSDSTHTDAPGSGIVTFDHDPIPTVYEGDDPKIEALLFDGTNRVRVE